jgi:hypothetical protein
VTAARSLVAMNAPEARITRRSNLDAAQIGRTAPLPIS